MIGKSLFDIMIDKNISLNILQDWSSNKQNIKGRIIMILYRLAALLRSYPLLTILFFWYLIIYKIFIGWIFNIEIGSRVKIGRGLKLEYGYGSVINGNAVLGNYCTIRQLTTIGTKWLDDGSIGPSPLIGDNVDIGVNATIIGNIKIGSNVSIGAGAVVTKDIDPNCVVGGNPAIILKMVYQFSADEKNSLSGEQPYHLI